MLCVCLSVEQHADPGSAVDDDSELAGRCDSHFGESVVLVSVEPEYESPSVAEPDVFLSAEPVFLLCAESDIDVSTKPDVFLRAESDLLHSESDIDLSTEPNIDVCPESDIDVYAKPVVDVSAEHHAWNPAVPPADHASGNPEQQQLHLSGRNAPCSADEYTTE